MSTSLYLRKPVCLFALATSLLLLAPHAQARAAVAESSAISEPGAGPLTWEQDHLRQTPNMESATANYSFAFTNATDSEAVIDHVTASCSCTAAKLPSQPWHIAPHTNGHVDVAVNLSGKAGTFDKTLTVYFDPAGAVTKVLRVTVDMPDKTMMRSVNVKLAQGDRQAVFKGDCAGCHAAPAKTATGKVLFHEVCGICHEAHPRATMVPDLHLINHPTDLAYWKTMIANGKPGTLMPAFAVSQGGPLTDAQIDGLAKVCLRAMPYHPPPPAENAPAVPASRN